MVVVQAEEEQRSKHVPKWAFFYVSGGVFLVSNLTRLKTKHKALYCGRREDAQKSMMR